MPFLIIFFIAVMFLGIPAALERGSAIRSLNNTEMSVRDFNNLTEAEKSAFLSKGGRIK